MSLLETDPDVVDYLLRRKASQWVGHNNNKTKQTKTKAHRVLTHGVFLLMPSCFMNHRSSDLLQTEEPYTLSERRSSSDSNKVSSGELSPYDNNSPVMSERRAEPDSLDSEQTFRIPGQYGLVGQVTGWNRESGAESWGSKGKLFSQKLTVKGWALKWHDKSLAFFRHHIRGACEHLGDVAHYAETNTQGSTVHW